MATSERLEDTDGTYDVPALEGIHGSVKFVGPGGSRYAVIDDGVVTVTPTPADPNQKPDMTVTAFEPGDLARLVRGDINLVTSLLQGRIQVEGNPILALQIAGARHPDTGSQRRTQGQGAQKGGA